MLDSLTAYEGRHRNELYKPKPMAVPHAKDSLASPAKDSLNLHRKDSLKSRFKNPYRLHSKDSVK
jgi:hypothetical protein